MIGNTLTSVGERAFFECLGLTNLTIGNGVTNIGYFAFSECYLLAGVYFEGNAPAASGPIFVDSGNATAYYLPDTTGWDNFRVAADVPTTLWYLPYPVILDNGPDFGVKTNRFGFIISWAANASVVVEASQIWPIPSGFRWPPTQWPAIRPASAIRDGPIIPPSFTACVHRKR